MLSNELAQAPFITEYYELVRGERGRVRSETFRRYRGVMSDREPMARPADTEAALRRAGPAYLALVLGALVGVAGALVQPAGSRAGCCSPRRGRAGLLLGAAPATGSRAGGRRVRRRLDVAVILLTASRRRATSCSPQERELLRLFLLLAAWLSCRPAPPLVQEGGNRPATASDLAIDVPLLHDVLERVPCGFPRRSWDTRQGGQYGGARRRARPRMRS